MSPEQVRGDLLGRTTDIFSLGIVFWELMAKRKLFTGKTLEELAAKIKECRVPSLSDLDPMIPAELNRICLKALTPQVHLRYQTAGELAADLNDFLRLASAEGREKVLARLMQQLFPEDLADLKDKLRFYEGTQDDLRLKTDSTVQTAWENTGSLRTSRRQVKFRRRARATRANIIPFLAILTALVIFYRIGPNLIAQMKTKPPEAVQVVKPPPPPVVERKVASQNWAYITVHASPRARIWINGVLVGTTVVNDVQVPAETLVTVKVQSKGAKRAIVRKFTASPSSHNFFEMVK
jgi:serine/threonine protein kinase